MRYKENGNMEQIHIYSLDTGWINKKECDDCKDEFHRTVECRIDGEYTNLCHDCFGKMKKDK